jgi:2-aminoadipate transaminase
MDEHGMRTDALEEAFRSGPKFIYVLPNFQNPTGVTLMDERRHVLIDLAHRYGVPIIEDDPYGQLRYEGENLPSVVVLDGQERDDGGPCYRGNVIYLSTFSKILAPGIRLAWVIAPPEVISKLVQAKQGADLHTASFTQMVAFEVSHGGFLDRHIELIRKVYKERRDVMLAAMDRHFPAEVDWTQPEGGLFLWGVLPDYLKAADVLRSAVEEKVAFVPGEPFYPCGGGHNTMRLNFSNATPENIREGIARLGKVLSEKAGRKVAA